MRKNEKNQLNPSVNTPFDDVFRTIAEKMPELMIPLINEVFRTDYSEADLLHQGRNEFTSNRGKVITDSIYYFRDRTYHIECESRANSNIAIRMFEYDFFIALERSVRKNGRYEVDFPSSTMLFLRKPKKAKKELFVKINLPVGKSFLYTLPVVYSADYSLDELFEKKLFLLLPFYIMRYEKEFREIEEDPDRLRGFLLEFHVICAKLKEVRLSSEKSGLMKDLFTLIGKIADHVLRNREKMRKGVEDVMGGKILELPSDKLRAAYAEGETKGFALMAQLASCLANDGKADLIAPVMLDEKERQRYLEQYGLR